MKEMSIFDTVPKRPVFASWVNNPKEQWTAEQLAEWEHKMQAYSDEVKPFLRAGTSLIKDTNQLAEILRGT